MLAREFTVFMHILWQKIPQSDYGKKKNRVAPIKHTTLSRLELIEAVVGAKIAKYLNGILNVKSATVWCDNQVVLYWFIRKSQWINSLSIEKQWSKNQQKDIHGNTFQQTSIPQIFKEGEFPTNNLRILLFGWMVLHS